MSVNDDTAHSSAESSLAPDRKSAASGPPRFSWPMRLFLAYYLFDMFTRSMLSLTPASGDWRDELSMDRNPRAIPSRAELEQCSKGTHPDGFTSAGECYMASIRSCLRYFVPVPSQATREKCDSVQNVGKYALTWTASRLEFVGRLVGVDQNWPMFSPNVGNGETIARLQLVYADGSEEEHRLVCDPQDLTRYSHWFEEKFLQATTRIHRDSDARLGYCQMIARRTPQNDQGAELIRIRVFKVHYDYPSPDDDAHAFLSQQSGPPATQVDAPFWEYDVATDKGKWL